MKLTCLRSASHYHLAPHSPWMRRSPQAAIAFISLLWLAAEALALPPAPAKIRKKAVAHNIAIVIDTSAHMSMLDRGCGKDQLNCVLAGLRTLLIHLYPCNPSKASCGPATDGNVTDPVDKVSIFVAPPLHPETAAHEFDCSDLAVSTAPYTFPPPGATSYKPAESEATYQVLDYSSDYRASDSDPTLNAESNLVRALGGKPGCRSLTDRGGFGTYFAGAIYAAQASLIAERKARSGSKNVLIVIGTGDSASNKNQMGSPRGNLPPEASDSGNYPSWVNECAQEIVAARSATSTGTKVYSIAYSGGFKAPYATSQPTNSPQPQAAQNNRGCPTDSIGAAKEIDTCKSVQQMASSAAYFYADATNGATIEPCPSTKHPGLNLDQIFTQIAQSLQPSPHPKPSTTQSSRN